MAMYYWRGSTQGTHSGITAEGATGSSSTIFGPSFLGGTAAKNKQFWSQFGWNVPGNWLKKEAATGGSGDFEGWNYRRTTDIPGGGDHVRFARLRLPTGIVQEGNSGGSTAALGERFEDIPHTPLLWGGFWHKPGSGATHEMGWLYAGNTSDKLKTIRIEPSYGQGIGVGLTANAFHKATSDGRATHTQIFGGLQDHGGEKFAYKPMGTTGGNSHPFFENKNGPDGPFQTFGAWAHIGALSYHTQHIVLDERLGGSTHEFGGFSAGLADANQVAWINTGVTAGHSQNRYALPGFPCIGLSVKAEAFLGVPDGAMGVAFTGSQIDNVYASGNIFKLQGGTYGEVHALTPGRLCPRFAADFVVDDANILKAKYGIDVPVSITSLLDVHTGTFYDPEFPSFTAQGPDTDGAEQGSGTAAKFYIKSSTTIPNVVVTAPARPGIFQIDANVTTASIYPCCRRAIGLNVSYLHPFDDRQSLENAYQSVDFVSPPGVFPSVPRTITNLSLYASNPTTGIPDQLRNVFREGEVLSETETYAPGTTQANTNPSGMKGVNNIVGLDGTGNFTIDNLFLEGGRVILGSVGRFGAGIQTGNLGPDGHDDSPRLGGGEQIARFDSSDQVLIKKGELGTDGHIDGRNPDSIAWRSFKLGDGITHPSLGAGIKVVGEKADIDLPVGQRIVSDFDSNLGGTSGTTSPSQKTAKPVAVVGFGRGPKG